ncbi:hypothetical protein PPTG_23769 [Phytophthora nicotianae INRA-310]|uniref:PiggyBac transposable element-derived protein domain-containing protein n=1 Tax=Phytophthora nicotianae (strain INRA-310) TaxID=761204 RepID=W2PRQ3_PHYN3|nr:hypothetical protein PPTG_23769 [Phytophthora nicotianae INRA-310]ETN03653.1 hypothetical protein PPTG_23769 [Phytophthora nicotianae INRA-310]
MQNPNIALANENQNDYMRLDSDDDTEDASVFSDDDDRGPSEAAFESNGIAPDLHFDPELLNAIGGVTEISRGNVDKTLLSDIKFNGWTDPSNVTPCPYMDEPYEARPDSWMSEDYPGIYDGDYGSTPGALNAAETPACAFFRLAPPGMCETIAGPSDDYFEANLDKRVAVQHAKQQARSRKHRDFQVQPPEQIKDAHKRTPELSGREMCVFIGLLTASTIAPKKEKFEHH